VLDRRGISADEVDTILVATVTPDMFFPATACLVQDRLGASSAWGFDISAACSGFLFALSTGARFIESGHSRKVLVIGADKMSSIVDYTDRTTCILFGDGAGAVLLEPDVDGYGMIDSIERVDGADWQSLCMRCGGSLNPSTHETIDANLHRLHQEGRPVFKRAVEGMADVAAEIMTRNDLSGDDVRYLVPHQANLRIIDATARRMGITMDKVMLNIEHYGNTTAGTIPLCLYDWERDLRPGRGLRRRDGGLPGRQLRRRAEPDLQTVIQNGRPEHVHFHIRAERVLAIGFFVLVVHIPGDAGVEPAELKLDVFRSVGGRAQYGGARHQSCADKRVSHTSLIGRSNAVGHAIPGASAFPSPFTGLAAQPPHAQAPFGLMRDFFRPLQPTGNFCYVIGIVRIFQKRGKPLRQLGLRILRLVVGKAQPRSGAV